MAVNPSTRSAPPLTRCLTRRSPLTFFKFTSFRPVSSTGARSTRIVSVPAQNSGSDGVGSKTSTNIAATEAPTASSTASAIDFLTLCHRLETTKRKGWVNHGVKGPESIADHMYRMALIAGDLPGVKRERCIKIAIVHDMAEAIVGDITPSDGVPKEEKRRREQVALYEMCNVLGGGMRAEEIQELWAEYENNASLEANLVKDFDKVEMILQVLEYAMGKPFEQFTLWTTSLSCLKF